jgi:hypothetical protein
MAATRRSAIRLLSREWEMVNPGARVRFRFWAETWRGVRGKPQVNWEDVVQDEFRKRDLWMYCRQS